MEQEIEIIVVDKQEMKEIKKMQKYSQKQEIKARKKALEEKLLNDEVETIKRNAERRRIKYENFKLNTKINAKNFKEKVENFFLGK